MDLSLKLYNKRDKGGGAMVSKEVELRIDNLKDGSIFILNDFIDITLIKNKVVHKNIPYNPKKDAKNKNKYL